MESIDLRFLIQIIIFPTIAFPPRIFYTPYAISISPFRPFPPSSFQLSLRSYAIFVKKYHRLLTHTEIRDACMPRKLTARLIQLPQRNLAPFSIEIIPKPRRFLSFAIVHAFRSSVSFRRFPSRRAEDDDRGAHVRPHRFIHSTTALHTLLLSFVFFLANK